MPLVFEDLNILGSVSQNRAVNHGEKNIPYTCYRVLYFALLYSYNIQCIKLSYFEKVASTITVSVKYAPSKVLSKLLPFPGHSIYNTDRKEMACVNESLLVMLRRSIFSFFKKIYIFELSLCEGCRTDTKQ
jgi:hypothetical protein